MNIMQKMLDVLASIEYELEALTVENKELKELNEQYLNWLPASYYICNEDTNERS